MENENWRMGLSYSNADVSNADVEKPTRRELTRKMKTSPRKLHAQFSGGDSEKTSPRPIFRWRTRTAGILSSFSDN